MDTTKTLLRTPELIEAVQPLVLSPVKHEDVFQLIGTGEIKPLGYIQRIPVFGLGQISDIAKKFRRKNILSESKK